MPFRLLHIELENIEIEMTLLFANIMQAGIIEMVKKGLIPKNFLSPDWK